MANQVGYAAKMGNSSLWLLTFYQFFLLRSFNNFHHYEIKFLPVPSTIHIRFFADFSIFLIWQTHTRGKEKKLAKIEDAY